MDDIDVEPVEEVAADAETDHDHDHDRGRTGADGPATVGAEPGVEYSVASPEYVLYGGKGGVGKTTMAAATGLASAAQGTRTLVVSTDPAHSLSDVFGVAVPPEPTRLRPDLPLYGVEIDPDEAMADAQAVFGGEGQSPLGGMSEMLGEDADPMAGGMPGADEAAAVQQLLALLDDDRFDRVVVDTAPTGHTLRLLELPDVMDSMVGRLLTLRERLGGMLGGLGGLFGGDEPEPDEEDLDDLRAVSDRIERLRTTLRDPTRTDFRVVMIPEEMSVSESERLLGRLAEYDIPVGTVVVNRVMEDLTDVVDADRVDGLREAEVDLEAVSPDLETCEFCKRRWSVQQAALGRAQSVFRDHEVRRVPLFADEPRGDGLWVVAACLA
jgi:arsenite-transporting ATPase